jgi:hypothetical protein
VTVAYVVLGTIFSVVGLTLATEGVRTRIQNEGGMDSSFRRYVGDRMILIGLGLLGLGVLLLLFWLTT